MDKEQREAKLKAANDRVASAKSALEAAQKALKEAEAAGDATKVTTAQGVVKDAQEELADAEAEVMTLDADSSGDDDDDNEDLVNDVAGDLRDGTPKNKQIRVSKEKFDDLSEKAELFDQAAPIIAKLQKDPELAKRLMEGDDPDQSIEQRLKTLEEKERTEKRAAIAKAIKAATSTWPDFRTHWDSIKALLPGLEAQGISYADSLQRAYFAVNPEAVAQGKRIVDVANARDRENKRGTMNGAPGGGGPRVHTDTQDEGYELSEADQEFARATGLDPKLYAKHAEGIKRFADL